MVRSFLVVDTLLSFLLGESWWIWTFLCLQLGLLDCTVCLQLLTLVRSRISSFPLLLPWRWRRYVPPKRRLTQYVHGAKSQKTAFFIVTTMKTSNLTITSLLSFNLRAYPYLLNWQSQDPLISLCSCFQRLQKVIRNPILSDRTGCSVFWARDLAWWTQNTENCLRSYKDISAYSDQLRTQTQVISWPVA
jgi:hypothetical protein